MSQGSPPSPARKGESLAKRSYTLRVTFSAMLTGCIVLLIAIGWAFMLGVIVGRGDNPEKQMPRLAGLLPGEHPTGGAEGEKNGEIPPAAEIMKLEELRFSSSLKGKPGQHSVEAKAKNAHNAAVPTPLPLPASHPAAPSLPVPAETGAPAAPNAVHTTGTEREAPKEQIFDFVFQVATFKDAESVDRLRARLEGLGLRTRMDRNGKLLKVMVLLRGNAEGGRNMQRQMADMGLGNPIQLSKTLVKGRR